MLVVEKSPLGALEHRGEVKINIDLTDLSEGELVSSGS
jgi:hypothetical protein